MQNIIIDEEFKSLLPSLDNDTYAALEENLIENGCRDSLILWENILIDGHNRYEICLKHGIQFNTVNKEFASREEVLIWIISIQVSRRNLSPMQLSYYRGRHYKADKIMKGTYSREERENHKSQNGTYDKSTAERLSDQYNVSRNTIIRDTKLSDATDAIGEFSPEAKRMILAGKAKIDKKELEKLASATSDEVAEIAMKIKDGTYEKPKPETTSASKEANRDSPVFDVTWPLDVALSNMTEEFYSSIRWLTKNNEEDFKKALRVCIDMLEDVYKAL